MTAGISLTDRISDFAISVADQFNKRPIGVRAELPPEHPQDRQQWIRDSDGKLFQYSSFTGAFEPIYADISNDKPLDGGNF